MRAYGEMVALLWDDGDVASALALEDLWNDLGDVRAFELLCAYPMSAFEDPDSAAPFKRVCEQHSSVIPSEGYSLLTDDGERTRAVARLQQETAVAARRGPAPARAARGPRRARLRRRADRASATAAPSTCTSSASGR